MAKASASQVADWLVWFANDHGDPLSNLRLQKLLYYAQGWHLALYGEPIFEDDFEAWIHGPVLPALYRRFRNYGAGPILPKSSAARISESLPEPAIPTELRRHLLDVLDAYDHLKTWQLERLVHEETPWLEARGGLEPDLPCQAPISKASMMAYYGAKADPKVGAA